MLLMAEMIMMGDDGICLFFSDIFWFFYLHYHQSTNSSRFFFYFNIFIHTWFPFFLSSFFSCFYLKKTWSFSSSSSLFIFSEARFVFLLFLVRAFCVVFVLHDFLLACCLGNCRRLAPRHRRTRPTWSPSLCPTTWSWSSWRSRIRSSLRSCRARSQARCAVRGRQSLTPALFRRARGVRVWWWWWSHRVFVDGWGCIFCLCSWWWWWCSWCRWWSWRFFFSQMNFSLSHGM